jgi:hypothetical protein
VYSKLTQSLLRLDGINQWTYRIWSRPRVVCLQQICESATQEEKACWLQGHFEWKTLSRSHNNSKSHKHDTYIVYTSTSQECWPKANVILNYFLHVVQHSSLPDLGVQMHWDYSILNEWMRPLKWPNKLSYLSCEAQREIPNFACCPTPLPFL